jgi:hypothetical protein
LSLSALLKIAAKLAVRKDKKIKLAITSSNKKIKSENNCIPNCNRKIDSHIFDNSGESSDSDCDMAIRQIIAAKRLLAENSVVPCNSSGCALSSVLDNFHTKRLLAEKSVISCNSSECALSSVLDNSHTPCKDIIIGNKKLAFNANCDHGTDSSDSLSDINEGSNSFVTPVKNFNPFPSDDLDNGSDDDVVIVRPIAASHSVTDTVVSPSASRKKYPIIFKK